MPTSAQETKQQPPRIPNRNPRWTLFLRPRKIVYCLSYAAMNIHNLADLR